MKRFLLVLGMLAGVLCSCSDDTEVLYDVTYTVAGGDKRVSTELSIEYLNSHNESVKETVSFKAGYNLWEKEVHGVTESFIPRLKYKEIKGGDDPSYAIGIETTGKSSSHTEFLPYRENEISIRIYPQ